MKSSKMFAIPYNAFDYSVRPKKAFKSDQPLEAKIYTILDEAMQSDDPVAVLKNNLSVLKDFLLYVVMPMIASDKQIEKRNEKIVRTFLKRKDIPSGLKKEIRRLFNQLSLNRSATHKFLFYVEEVGMTSDYIKWTELGILLQYLFALALKAINEKASLEVLNLITISMHSLLDEFEELSDRIVRIANALAIRKSVISEDMSA